MSVPGAGACYATGERHESSILDEADVSIHGGVELWRTTPRDTLHVNLSLTLSCSWQHVYAVVPNIRQAATQCIQVAEEQLGEVALPTQEQAIVDIQIKEALG